MSEGYLGTVGEALSWRPGSADVVAGPTGRSMVSVVLEAEVFAQRVEARRRWFDLRDPERDDPA